MKLLKYQFLFYFLDIGNENCAAKWGTDGKGKQKKKLIRQKANNKEEIDPFFHSSLHYI